jgi:hypothetical protein
MPVTGKERPMRRGAKPGKAKVEAKPPVVRKTRKSEGSAVDDLEKRLAEALRREAEALERQTATSEILRVIRSSPSDVQPVFDAIVRSATKLCDAAFGSAFRFDGQLLTFAAHLSGSPTDLQPVFDSMLQSAVRLLGGFGGAILLYDGSALHLGAVMGGRPQSGAEDWCRSIYPIPLDPDTPVGSAILERRMIQLPDTEESASQITREVARANRFTSSRPFPRIQTPAAILRDTA